MINLPEELPPINYFTTSAAHRRTIKWRKENIEKAKQLENSYYQKHKKNILESFKDYQQELRKLDKELGNCLKCHRNQKLPNRSSCEACYIKYYLKNGKKTNS